MSLDPTQDPNQEFLAKLNGERVLRILLSTRRAEASTSGVAGAMQAQEGLLPAKHSRKKLYGGGKSAFINFWDLGIWDQGSGLVTRTGIPPNSTPTNTDADLRNWLNAVVAESGDWREKFGPITDISKYYMAAYFKDKADAVPTEDYSLDDAVNEKWVPGSGLKFNRPFNSFKIEANRVTPSISQPFYARELELLLFEFELEDSHTHWKVTTEPSRNAAQVPVPTISPADGDVDIFISPVIYQYSATDPASETSYNNTEETDWEDLDPTETWFRNTPGFAGNTVADDSILVSCSPDPGEIGFHAGWQEAVEKIKTWDEGSSVKSIRMENFEILDRAEAFADQRISSTDPTEDILFDFLDDSGVADILNYTTTITGTGYTAAGKEDDTNFYTYAGITLPASYWREYLCGWRTWDPNAYIPALSLPTIGGPDIDESTSAATGSVDSTTWDIEVVDTFRPLGALIAAIKQGSNTWYIWSRVITGGVDPGPEEGGDT